MNSRETILASIREALKAKAPLPGAHDRANHAAAAGAAAFKAWLPLVGESFDEQCQLFAQNAAMLKAAFKPVSSPEQAAAELRQIIAAEKWKKYATHASPLTNQVCANLGIESMRTDVPYETADLEKCEGSVTACEGLIAQTGSVLISSRACGGRAVSILPPHHVVVATRDQMLPDLAAAFELVQKKYGGNYPSTISLITGPSRTGDIERILVLGAHGPKQLTIFLIG